MFCSNCGTNLPDGTAFCPSCGRSQDSASPVQNSNENSFAPDYTAPAANLQQPAPGQPYAQQPYYPPVNSIPTNGLATAGFVLGLVGLFTCGVTSIIGLILSIVGLVQSGKHLSKPGKGLAIAGIITSAVVVVLSLLLTIIFIIGIGLV